MPTVSVSPRRFERQIERGRSKPLLLTVVDADGQRFPVVAKLLFPTASHGFQGPFLMRELVSSLLLAQLGLPVPEPLLVEITDAFAASFDDPELNKLVSASVGLAFGCRFVEGTVDGVTAGLEAWQNVCKFDAYAFNGDRRADNPNVLFDGESLWMIDHQLVAPTDSFDASGTPDTELWGQHCLADHASYPFLRGNHQTLAVPMQAWQPTLTDGIDVAIAATPLQWAGAADRARLKDFLLNRAAILHDQGIELEAWLG